MWGRTLVLQGKQPLKSSEPSHFHHREPVRPGLLLGSKAVFLLRKVRDLSRPTMSLSRAERQTLLTNVPVSPVPGDRKSPGGPSITCSQLELGNERDSSVLLINGRLPSLSIPPGSPVVPLTGGTGGQGGAALGGEVAVGPKLPRGLELSWLFV